MTVPRAGWVNVIEPSPSAPAEKLPASGIVTVAFSLPCVGETAVALGASSSMVTVKLVGTFGPHLQLSQRPAIVDEAPARIAAAEKILGRVNQLIDAAGNYGSDLVEACVTAFQTLKTTFNDERAAAEEWARLGPMQPDEYREARRIFLEDLAARHETLRTRF